MDIEAIFLGISGIITALGVAFAAYAKANRALKLACQRIPCPDRIPLDALESKSSKPC